MFRFFQGSSDVNEVEQRPIARIYLDSDNRSLLKLNDAVYYYRTWRKMFSIPSKIFILQTDWSVIFPIFANQSVCYGKESG